MKLFTLFADLTLDTSEFTKNVASAKTEMNGFDTTGIQAKAVALGNALYDVSVKALEMGVSLGKAIYGEYADTEQLLGGVTTIFKDNADTVIENANRAFQMTGMSANDYMDTVIGFSSRLLQGLNGDTARAAAYADLALTDMADNANKFGSSMTMVQNAYQGFSRNNFTMLDNLKLGYGGTQEEMVRLLNDSEVLVGTLLDDEGKVRDAVVADLQDIPLYKMIEAIHVIQTEMDVTGTTAKEAADTLSGSTASFEAAWNNLLAGMANKDADVEELRENVIQTGMTMVENYATLFPTIMENSMRAIFGIEETAEEVAEDVKDDFLDNLVEIQETSTAALALVNALAELEKGGLTAEEQTQWDAMVASMTSDLPLLGEAIGANTGVIEGGSKALEEYVNDWRTASIEVGRLSALDEYNQEIGEQEVKTAEAKTTADAARAYAEETERLWGQVWQDAVSLVDTYYERPSNELSVVLGSEYLSEQYLSELEYLGKAGNVDAQAYYDLLKNLESSESAWAKYNEAESAYQEEYSELEALRSQQEVLLAAVNALSAATNSMTNATESMGTTVEVTVYNEIDGEPIVSRVTKQIRTNANTKAMTAGGVHYVV